MSDVCGKCCGEDRELNLQLSRVGGVDGGGLEVWSGNYKTAKTVREGCESTRKGWRRGGGSVDFRGGGRGSDMCMWAPGRGTRFSQESAELLKITLTSIFMLTNSNHNPGSYSTADLQF